MNDTIFRILFGLSVLTVVAIVLPYRRKAQKGEAFSYREEGLAVAVPLRLFGLLVWGYAFTYPFAAGWLGWSLVDIPAGLRWFGAVVALLLFPPLAIWTQRSLGNNVSPTVITRKSHELVTQGPYRWVRHPLYTLGLLYFFSLSLVAGSWFLALAGLGGLVMLLIRTPEEERRLEARFGDRYREYRLRTGRFLPRLGVRPEDSATRPS
jgi:protein-S-isoprenylcysteine O-methyltransferase Ste14